MTEERRLQAIHLPTKLKYMIDERRFQAIYILTKLKFYCPPLIKFHWCTFQIHSYNFRRRFELSSIEINSSEL